MCCNVIQVTLGTKRQRNALGQNKKTDDETKANNETNQQVNKEGAMACGQLFLFVDLFPSICDLKKTRRL